MTDIPKPDLTGARAANQRGAARLAAVQALYQMDVGRATLEDTLAQFGAFHLGREVEGEQYLPADADFFGQIVRGVTKSQLEIDPAIDQALADDWPMERIDATLRAILRAAATFPPASSSPNMSTSPAPSTKMTPPASSTPRSMLWRGKPACT